MENIWINCINCIVVLASFIAVSVVMYFVTTSRKNKNEKYVHKKSGIVVELIDTKMVCHNIDVFGYGDIDIDDYVGIRKDEMVTVQSSKDGMYYIMSRNELNSEFNLLI